MENRSLSLCRRPVTPWQDWQQWSFLAMNGLLFKKIIAFWLRLLALLYTNNWIQPLKLLNIELQGLYPRRDRRLWFDRWSKNHGLTSSLGRAALLAHAGGTHRRSCTDTSPLPGNLCRAHFKLCFPRGSSEHSCSFNELHWKLLLWSSDSRRAETLSKLIHPGACINCSLPVFVILFSSAVVLV